MNADASADVNWMRSARFGAFLHFLADAASTHDAPDLTTDAWNRRVDSFDTDQLAYQLADAGVPVLGITLGQNSGFYCSPNATYDAIVGRPDSRLSRRDLIADLIASLRSHDIRLMVYLPSHAPAHDPLAVEKLACRPGWDARLWSFRAEQCVAPDESDDPRLARFQQHWEAIIREWSMRWGSAVSAWWMDGVYFADRMYRTPDAPNFRTLAAALRAGNPLALVSFNEGIRVPRLQPLPGSGRDFLSGEADFALPVNGRWYDGSTIWQNGSVGGEQLFVFTFLGRFWGVGPTRFPDELVRGYTRHVNDAGGFVLWDVPFAANGTLPDDVRRQLSQLSSRSCASVS